jgi:hypothetical protein
MASRITSGVEAMKLLNSGALQQVPPEVLEKVRNQVSLGCEEILDCGARIRPLRVRDRQVGWVRGVHLSEKKILHRWLSDSGEFLIEMLLLGSSFTREELMDFTAIEIRSLARLISKMQEYDLSLYPYLNAFSTTLMSEKLWHAKGTTLSSYTNKIVELPNGNKMKILTPPDHAQIWSTLCTYREGNKLKIESNMNALMVTRAFVGSKATSQISDELRKAGQRLRPDIIDPWQKVVKPQFSYYKDDGWAHGGGDSWEDLKRELEGIEKFDKHEQLMAAFEKQQREAAEAENRRIEDLVRKYHKDEPIWEEAPVVLSEAEVHAQTLKIKHNRAKLKPDVPHDDPTARDRMRRYDH